MLKSRLMVAACAACVMSLVGTGASAQSGGDATSPELGTWGFDLEGRDLTVQPGDDFEQYANGTWLRTHDIPADKVSYGAFDMLYDKSQEQLKAIIEDSAANPTSSADSALVGALYGSFMDEARINGLGAAPLDADLAAIRAATSRDDIAALMGNSTRGFGASIFGPAVFEDLRDASAYAAYISHGGLGMPDRDYYLKPEMAEVKTAYQAYVVRALTMAGWDNPEASAEAILGFETRLAEKQWPADQRRQFDKLYNPMTPAEIEAFAPGFEWGPFIQAAGLSGADKLVVMEQSAFPDLARVYADTPVETLQAWQAFHTIDQASPYLSQDFVDSRFDFAGKVLGGATENRPRWKRGVSLVNGQLGESLGREYVRRHFPAESKTQMEVLVGNLSKAMTSRIEGLEWMSDETREQALYKMSKFGLKIGYPEQWRSYDGLELRADDLYGNVERSNAFEWVYSLGKLSRPIDPHEWDMNPQDVNAYYHPTRNEIVFPAAILQPPFFDPNADAAVNYGAIGAVIGHEITHGFDDQGRKFDGDGLLRDWWTAEDSAKFEARAAVLGAQYDALEALPGLNVNGTLTMGENIADLGGLLLALDAYKMSLNGQEAPVIDGLTGEQRVFLGWAQVWRDKMREEALRDLVTTNPHSPGNFRAGQTPRNIDAWYEAFGVTPEQGAYIAPEHRARIW